MSASKSQIRLLLAVAVLAVVAGLFAPAVELVRDWQLLPGGSLQLSIVVVISGLAPWVAIRVGNSTGANRPVKVLLATAAGGLAASLVSPFAGALWGMLAATALVYPDSIATRLLLSVLRWGVAFSAGVAGVALARRVYMDGGPYRWASLLLFLVTVLIQFSVLCSAALRRRLSTFLNSESDTLPANPSLPGSTDDKRTSPGEPTTTGKSCDEGGRRSRWTALAASGVGSVLLLAVPLSWKAGWHVEMTRRVRAISEKGGSIRFDRSEFLAAVWKSAAEGDWRFQEVSALPPHPNRWSVDSDWVRDLLWSPPAASVTLRNPSGQDIRTLRALYGIQKLAITGSGVDDAMLSELPLLEDVSALMIHNTNVRGTFLSQSDRLRGIVSVRIEQSPFTDDGLNQLDQRLSANQYWSGSRSRWNLNLAGLRLIGTQVTPRGIEPLIRRAIRQPIWPPLWTDVSFDEQQLPLLTKVLRHPDRRGRRWAVERISNLDPLAVTSLLIEALEDPDSSGRSVRFFALNALGRIGSASTTSQELSRTVERALDVPLLIRVFGHGDTQARKWALGRVIAMDPVMTVPALIEALDEPYHSYALKALMRIGSSSATSREVFQTIEHAWEKRLNEGRLNARDMQRVQMELFEMREARATFEKVQVNTR